MNTVKRTERERDPVTHERFGRGLAGLTVMATVVLGYVHSPYWLLVALGVAANLTLSALTDRCAVKNLLIRLGLPGERDLGRAEALGVEPSTSNALLSHVFCFLSRKYFVFFRDYRGCAADNSKRT